MEEMIKVIAPQGAFSHVKGAVYNGEYWIVPKSIMSAMKTVRIKIMYLEDAFYDKNMTLAGRTLLKFPEQKGQRVKLGTGVSIQSGLVTLTYVDNMGVINITKGTEIIVQSVPEYTYLKYRDAGVDDCDFAVRVTRYTPPKYDDTVIKYRVITKDNIMNYPVAIRMDGSDEQLHNVAVFIKEYGADMNELIGSRFFFSDEDFTTLMITYEGSVRNMPEDMITGVIFDFEHSFIIFSGFPLVETITEKATLIELAETIGKIVQVTPRHHLGDDEVKRMLNSVLGLEQRSSPSRL